MSVMDSIRRVRTESTTPPGGVRRTGRRRRMREDAGEREDFADELARQHGDQSPQDEPAPNASSEAAYEVPRPSPHGDDEVGGHLDVTA